MSLSFIPFSPRGGPLATRSLLQMQNLVFAHFTNNNMVFASKFSSFLVFCDFAVQYSVDKSAADMISLRIFVFDCTPSVCFYSPLKIRKLFFILLPGMIVSC